MLPQKEYTYVGDHVNSKTQTKLFLGIGIVGALLLIYCSLTPMSDLGYLIACFLLLLCALYFKLTYYIALEMILISGHGAVLLGLGPLSQLIIPILLCLQLLMYYLLSGRLWNIFRLTGIAGIVLLTIGFAYEYYVQWFLLFGSLAVTVFSFYQVYRKRFAAWIWAVLNILLACISLFKLIL